MNRSIFVRIFACAFTMLSAGIYICYSVPSVIAGQIVEQWIARSSGRDHAAAIALDSADNVVVTGYSLDQNNFADYYTAKYSSAGGALIWEKRYDGIGNINDYAKAVVTDGPGNVVVTGGSSRSLSSGGGMDFYTVKYAAADGAVLWERRYNGPGEAEDTGVAVAVDLEGSVIVTGGSAGAGTGSDYYTAKYASGDGAVLWEKRYDGPGNEADAATALGVDSAGNVIVTGASAGSGTGADFYTVKYAANDGEVLWEKRYDGPAGGDDVAASMSVDSAGNVIVTGRSVGFSSNADYFTIKYAAVDGAVLWEKRYNGSANGDDNPCDLALDSQGNPIVTGWSGSPTGSTDYYTAKYSASDGALIWEKRYNGGQGIMLDFAYAVVVDSGDNVIVTGGSYVNFGFDYYTVKYAPNGSLLWEKRYDGSLGSDDNARALALDSRGYAIVTGESWTGFGFSCATVKYGLADADEDGLLDSWEMVHFGTEETHSALDDADGDGRVELVEEAFGSDPLSPDARAPVDIFISGGYLMTIIDKRPGVIYVVQTAASPENGSFSAASTTVLTETDTTLIVRDNVPMGAAVSRFMRVKVSSMP